MSTYKALVGKKIKSVSSDPSDSIDGQMWYNTTTQSLRGLAISEAWVSSGPLVQDYRSGGFAGDTQAAFMIFGGYPVPTSNNKTFEYNGAGWTAGGNLGTGKYLNGGAGTLTAGLDYGGYNGSSPHTIPGGNVTQEYDGSSWSNASAAMGTARYNCLGSGTQTAALSAGGISSPPANAPSANNNFSEEYNGSSWSEGNNLNTPRNVSGSQSGTQTAAIMFGGLAYPSSFKSDVENYDGTSWTSGVSLPAGRVRAGSSGTQTDALVYGGNLPPVTNTCFSFDGTSFSSVPSLATARQTGGRAQNAPSTGSVLCGGSPSPKTVTEEFNRSTNAVTAAAWASSGNMNTGSYNPSALVGGTQTAAIAAGGDTGPPAFATNKSEQYDGSSWTSTPTLNSIRAAGTGTGTSTASIVFGAYPASNGAATESWNGSSWTTTPATLGAPVERAGGAGTQTAALAFAYYNRPGSSAPTTVYSYNGSAWTTSPASMNTGRYGGSGLGTQTAAIAIGGITSAPAQSAVVEQWDGSSWTTKSSLTTARGYGGASGLYTSAIFFGGNPSSATGATEGWDGTSWSTRPSLGTARGGLGSSGTSADLGLAYGGGSYLASTEEFTGETTAVNIETFSTS